MLVDLGISMGVFYLQYKILPILKEDLFEINKILIKEIGVSSLKNLKEHLRHGIAIKLVDENKNMVAFCLAQEYSTYFSLSYYYIYENQRKKWESLFFFIHCFSKMQHKPIYVKKNTNYEMYSKYFEETADKDILRFKNLREEKEWVELLNRFQK